MVRELAEHVAVGGRRGEADRGAKSADRGKQVVRRGLLQQDGGGADPQREQHQPAKPEGERDRRRTDETIVTTGAQHVFAEGVADRQHVAMKMHGALGHAGGARGEGDQAHVVARGIASLEMLIARLHHQSFEAVTGAGTPIDDLLEHGRERPRLLHFVRKPHVAQRKADFGLADRERDLLGAQQRHGGDHDGAGLDDGKIGRHHHRAVGSAQQNPISGNDPEIAREYVGDAVYPLRQTGIGQALRRRNQAIAVAVPGGAPSIDERGHAVQSVRIAQVRQGKQKVRQQIRRRQMIPRKRIDVCRADHGCVILPLAGHDFAAGNHNGLAGDGSRVRRTRATARCLATSSGVTRRPCGFDAASAARASSRLRFVLATMLSTARSNRSACRYIPDRPH